MAQLSFASNAPPHAALAAIALMEGKGLKVDIVHSDSGCPVLVHGDNVIPGAHGIARYLARNAPACGLYGTDSSPEAHAEVDSWVDFAVDYQDGAGNLAASALASINDHLKFRSFFAGYGFTLADLAVWHAVSGDISNYPYLTRWYNYCADLMSGSPRKATSSGGAKASPKVGKESTAAAPVADGEGKSKKQLNKEAKAAKDAASAPTGPQKSLEEQIAEQEALLEADNFATPSDRAKCQGLLTSLHKRAEKTAGSAYKGLPGAIDGQVVTRFPPEPSGYLHIGHAKAAMLNAHYAKMYHGKMILRFDDTNPSKEKEEYVENIIQDLDALGIKADMITHTSDSFEKILVYGEQMIRNGFAYVDFTPVEAMREARNKLQATPCREHTVEQNLALWEEMKAGSEEGQKCCVRAKIDYAHVNGCLRDPVMYRCNVHTPHHRTGSKFKLYPTYDFACPIVDSLEGVTHTLRTNEYRDRNAQYKWFIQKMNLREPIIHDYSRLCFQYTVMSKRKLQWFVDTKRVEGWTDPRFPTVQGIRRRGLTIQALGEFIVSQGSSMRTVLMSWDKLWAQNKAVIDGIVPRYQVIACDGATKVTLTDVPEEPTHTTIPAHKKNPDVGMKIHTFAKHILIEGEDAATLAVGEEVTLIDWGNIIIDEITTSAKGTHIVAHTNLSGDPSATEKKLTWLADLPDLVPVSLVEYDYLITKEVIEEDEKIEDLVTPNSRCETACFGDANLRLVKKGDRMQLLRRDYWVCDQPYVGGDRPIVLFDIPDGKKSGSGGLSRKVIRK